MIHSVVNKDNLEPMCPRTTNHIDECFTHICSVSDKSIKGLHIERSRCLRNIFIESQCTAFISYVAVLNCSKL